MATRERPACMNAPRHCRRPPGSRSAHRSRRARLPNRLGKAPQPLSSSRPAAERPGRGRGRPWRSSRRRDRPAAISIVTGLGLQQARIWSSMTSSGGTTAAVARRAHVGRGVPQAIQRIRQPLRRPRRGPAVRRRLPQRRAVAASSCRSSASVGRAAAGTSSAGSRRWAAARMTASFSAGPPARSCERDSPRNFRQGGQPAPIGRPQQARGRGR